MPAGVFHMHACLTVHTYVRVCLLSRACFSRVCFCVCSCVFVFTMMNLPVVVCRRRCVSLCMYLRVYLPMDDECMECLCVYVYMFVHINVCVYLYG